jgi:tRNA C32,U32 (ribose-2'-O)-methylase TrmJ
VPLAPVDELERLYAHLDAVLREVDFTDRNGGPHLLRRLRRIFGRAELDQHEVNILRGVLAAVQAKRKRAGAGAGEGAS